MDRRGDDVHDDTRTAPGRDRAPAAVQTAGLVKEYRSRAGVVEAVRGVDLRLEAGEVFGFLGPNGAGKSTTVRMVTTLLSITSGTASQFQSLTNWMNRSTTSVLLVGVSVGMAKFVLAG